MKTLFLLLLSSFLFISASAYEVSGVAVNDETGDPLSGFDIILTYPEGGVAASTTTNADGSFTLTDVANGSYYLEYYSYPDPIMLNGDYFMNTDYEEQITVNGENVSGIEFNIPPHHPDYTLTGALLDANTHDTITIQDFQVRAKMQHYVEFFYDNSTDNGMYIIEDLPDWTYEFNVFENEYYEGVDTTIIVDTMGPDTIQIDYYLEPKMGATVSGVLLDSTTNEPIMQAGRTVKLQSVNSMFTETNAQGEFTFINVTPGTYSAIEVTSEDTSYVNSTGSEITGFTVPEEGVSDVELYQKPWVTLHEMTADEYYFEPGETKTIRFSIVNDDLSYGSIWGVNLVFPDGLTAQSTTEFYNNAGNDVTFDKLPGCSTEDIKAWEGWHWTGVPQFSSAEGNLEVLNESAWADVTVEFADSASMENAPIFYEIYYSTHCFAIEPFSYGTIMMERGSPTGIDESSADENSISSYPNPATNRAIIQVNLDKQREGEIALYNVSGQRVSTLASEVFREGLTEVPVGTGSLKGGIYYYSFIADDVRLRGKMIVTK